MVRSAITGIYHLLWNSEVCYSGHESSLPVPSPSQMIAIRTLQPRFPKIHFNIILPSVSGFFELSLHFRLSNQKFLLFFSYAQLMSLIQMNIFESCEK
jgi:hypothetical protein